MTQETKRYPFFVYGTLLPQQPNSHLWQDDVVTMTKAVLANGRLYDMGHYPMLVLEGEQGVRGLLMTVTAEAYTAVLARLDMLEGYDPADPERCAYQRQLQEVYLPERDVVCTAWVYVGRPIYVQRMVVIESGDWIAYVAAQDKELSIWWQDVGTVAGLHDLD